MPERVPESVRREFEQALDQWEDDYVAAVKEQLGEKRSDAADELQQAADAYTARFGGAAPPIPRLNEELRRKALAILKNRLMEERPFSSEEEWLSALGLENLPSGAFTGGA